MFPHIKLVCTLYTYDLVNTSTPILSGINTIDSHADVPQPPVVPWVICILRVEARLT
jgi:hypothetical protein